MSPSFSANWPVSRPQAWGQGALLGPGLPRRGDWAKAAKPSASCDSTAGTLPSPGWGRDPVSAAGMDDLQGQKWAGEKTGRVVEIGSDVESGPVTFGGVSVRWG